MNDFLQEEGKLRDQWTMKLMSLIHPSSSSSPRVLLGRLNKEGMSSTRGISGRYTAAVGLKMGPRLRETPSWPRQTAG